MIWLNWSPSGWGRIVFPDHSLITFGTTPSSTWGNCTRSTNRPIEDLWIVQWSTVGPMTSLLSTSAVTPETSHGQCVRPSSVFNCWVTRSDQRFFLSAPIGEGSTDSVQSVICVTWILVWDARGDNPKIVGLWTVSIVMGYWYFAEGTRWWFESVGWWVSVLC